MEILKWFDAVIDRFAEAVFTIVVVGFVVAVNHGAALETWGMLVETTNWIVAQAPMFHGSN